MFHMAALQGTTAAATTLQLTAVQDDILTRAPASGAFILPEDMLLYMAMSMQATGTFARLVSATLRQVNQPHIRPLNIGATPISRPPAQFFLDQPFRIPKNEEFSAEVQSTGIDAVTFLMALGLGLQSLPPGDVINCRATSTGAAVANAWTTIAYTLDQTLPPGRYAVVGSEHVAAGGLAHRWIMPNQFYRPGAPSNVLISNIPLMETIERRFGVWGEFENFALPQLQVLCNAATAVHTIFMQVIKIR